MNNDITKLPLWEECPECKGTGLGDKQLEPITEKYFQETCWNCGGKKVAPIRYTPESARAKGYKVQNDDPVWVLHLLSFNEIDSGFQESWLLDEYDGESVVKDMTGVYIILAIPGQGKPPADWRPE